MLKNYFQIDENTTVGAFLKDINDKKNMQYIILDTIPESFVDIRTIALKTKNSDEKLKNMKKPISICHGSNNDDYMNFLIESGERVVKIEGGYFDFLNALQNIKNHEFDFLKEKIKLDARKEVYALNEDDKISTAKNLMISKRINLLPVINENLKVLAEVRSMDFLANSLQNSTDRGGLYNEKYKESVLNMSISNLENNKPITMDSNSTYGEVMDTMISKRIAGLIITEGEKLSSIVTYKDIFREVKGDLEAAKYRIEYTGTSNLYEDEFDLIKTAAEKCMTKISKFADYDSLRITLKTHGNKEGSHQKKLGVNILLSKGNKVLHVDKEIVKGTSDENRNDKVKGAWNVPLMVQEALTVLEKKVKQEKNRS